MSIASNAGGISKQTPVGRQRQPASSRFAKQYFINSSSQERKSGPLAAGDLGSVGKKVDSMPESQNNASSCGHSEGRSTANISAVDSAGKNLCIAWNGK